MKDSLKVLMVEDVIADVDLIQFELKQAVADLKVKVVSNEKDFTSSLQKFKPDIILSDFSMPGFDGLSALKITQKILPETPFIFVSGTIGEERAIEALKSGATDYILKDHLAGLIPKLNRALKEAQERADKKKAKEELLKKQELLIEAQEIARIGNWEYNLKTKEIVWSDEIYKIFGFKPNSITPTQKLYPSCIHPEDLDYATEFRKKVYEDQQTATTSYRIIKKDTGEIRHVLVKFKFRRNESNHADMAYGIMQDITELKETERRLEESNKDLKTFIYKSSHDLRGPISSALGLLEIARDECDAKTIGYLNTIQECLVKLDYNVCTLTKVMSVKEKRAEMQKINFSQIYHNVISGLKFTDGFSEIKFSTKGLKTSFNSDPDIIFSILQNLIENSIRYQYKRNSESYIKLTIRRSKKGLIMELADNGVGIEKGIKDKIFDMFYRGNDASKGSGLGLYIVKSAVEKLKGTIKVNSAISIGTTFTIFLPDNADNL